MMAAVGHGCRIRRADPVDPPCRSGFSRDRKSRIANPKPRSRLKPLLQKIRCGTRKQKVLLPTAGTVVRDNGADLLTPPRAGGRMVRQRGTAAGIIRTPGALHRAGRAGVKASRSPRHARLRRAPPIPNLPRGRHRRAATCVLLSLPRRRNAMPRIGRGEQSEPRHRGDRPMRGPRARGCVGVRFAHPNLWTCCFDATPVNGQWSIRAGGCVEQRMDALRRRVSHG